MKFLCEWDGWVAKQLPLYPRAFTMVGKRRIENVRDLLVAAIENNIPGDFLEAGVWRGGCSIFAKAVLAAYGEQNREVYVCDSFQGLPRASSMMDYDGWEVSDVLSVSLEAVRANFRVAGFLDNKVHFVKGFFNDSLPSLSRKKFRIAVLRADVDMYESTMDILFNLYSKLSVGGFLIIDDWGIPVARKAVRHFFHIHGISKYQVEAVDSFAAYIVKDEELVVDNKWYGKFCARRAVSQTYRTKKNTPLQTNAKCGGFPFASCPAEFSFQFVEEVSNY